MLIPESKGIPHFLRSAGAVALEGESTGSDFVALGLFFHSRRVAANSLLRQDSISRKTSLQPTLRPRNQEDGLRVMEKHNHLCLIFKFVFHLHLRFSYLGRSACTVYYIGISGVEAFYIPIKSSSICSSSARSCDVNIVLYGLYYRQHAWHY